MIEKSFGDATRPRITLVTPSLDQGRFLEQSIESVLAQGYDNLEYFVVDGGSSDQTLDLLRKYDREIDWWVSELDAGQSDAINKGFDRATGDVIAWLNSDDYLLAGALARVAKAWADNPRASFYFGDGLRVDEDGTEKRGFFPRGRVAFSRSALVWGLNFILQPAAFINRGIAGEAARLETTLNWGMDSDLWLRLSSLADPEPIPFQLAASREYSETKTDSASFERIEELRMIASRYADAQMTPGVLCYFLDTLHKECAHHPGVFPDAFVQDVEKLWASTASLMQRFGADSSGFPV